MSTATLAPQAPSFTSKARISGLAQKYSSVGVTLLLLVLMFVVGGIRYDGFASPQVFLNLFVNNSHLIVLAVGMTFVILTGGIDLSVGSQVALSTMIAAATLQAGWSPYLAIALVIVVCTTLGVGMGLVIYYFDVQPFIATLAGMFLARGLCYVISTESIPITDPVFQKMAMTSIPLPGGLYITISVVIALVILAIGAYVLHLTRFGRTVYAVGGNENSARLMGLPVSFVKVSVYGVSGLCAGLAGLLFCFFMLSGYPLHAVGMELDAISAVVIGGTLLTGGSGLVLGSLLGVLVMGTIQSFISFDGTLSSWWTKITIGALVLVFVVMQRFLNTRNRQ